AWLRRERLQPILRTRHKPIGKRWWQGREESPARQVQSFSWRARLQKSRVDCRTQKTLFWLPQVTRGYQGLPQVTDDDSKPPGKLGSAPSAHGLDAWPQTIPVEGRQ